MCWHQKYQILTSAGLVLWQILTTVLENKVFEFEYRESAGVPATSTNTVLLVTLTQSNSGMPPTLLRFSYTVAFELAHLEECYVLALASLGESELVSV